MLAIGAVAAFQAGSFDTASRMFPLIMSIALAAIGLVIVVRSFLIRSGEKSSSANLRHVVIAVMIVSAWLTMFSGGLGFVLPTFLMQVAFLWLGGLRSPIRVVSIAALVTVLAYLSFVGLLDLPMPPSELPDALQGF